jgi:NTE family protein
MSRSQTLGQVASLFSPYEFNPLGFDPLRKLLAERIDFGRLRAFDGIELLIAATDVATGRGRLFRRRDITVEAVLASTCLPTLHHAVEIEGRTYWDGGFSTNPDLVTLAAESPVGDTLLVLLNPVEKSAMPRTAREITGDVSRVTFTQPLLRDVAVIDMIRREHRGGLLRRRTRFSRISAHRFHIIEAGRHTGALSADSKLRPDKALIAALFSAGREEARKWLGRHWSDIGRRETAGLAERLLGPLTPLAPAASEPVDEDAVTEEEARAPRL